MIKINQTKDQLTKYFNNLTMIKINFKKLKKK